MEINIKIVKLGTWQLGMNYAAHCWIGDNLYSGYGNRKKTAIKRCKNRIPVIIKENI